MSTGIKFKPSMLGFICNWCCYGGADLCGVSRFQYPPYIRIIRVMCSARVDLDHIFLAFSTGQEGVFVGGCHLDDCHYVTHGNYDALSTVTIAKRLLNYIGVNPERLRLEWVSAGEGIRFAGIMNEFSMQVEQLGPLGTSENLEKDTLQFRLEAVRKIIPYIKLVQTERLTAPLTLRVPGKSEENYKKFFSSDEVTKIFNEAIADKLVMSEITWLLREQPLSRGAISANLGLNPSEVSRHIQNSTRHGLVRYDTARDCYTLA